MKRRRPRPASLDAFPIELKAKLIPNIVPGRSLSATLHVRYQPLPSGALRPFKCLRSVLVGFLEFAPSGPDRLAPFVLVRYLPSGKQISLPVLKSRPHSGCEQRKSLLYGIFPVFDGRPETRAGILAVLRRRRSGDHKKSQDRGCC